MTGPQKKKLLGTNVIVLTLAMLASFVLPKVAEASVDGKGTFLIALAQLFPLFVAIGLSTALLNNAITESAE